MKYFFNLLKNKQQYKDECGNLTKLLSSKQVIFLNGFGMGQTLKHINSIFCTSRRGDMSPLIQAEEER